MKIRTRIFLLFVLTIAGGVVGLVSWVQGEMRPRYMEAQEDPLVDMANILARLIAVHGVVEDEAGPRIDADHLAAAFDGITGYPVSAQIYALYKDRVDVRIYVTDAQGQVLYDSHGGRDLGEDYSQWRDVHHTLKGEYGARSSEGDPLYPDGSIMYIAAPISVGDEMLGVVSVGKPTRNLERFTAGAYEDLKYAAFLVALAAILLAFVLYRWLSRPLQRLHDYARAVQTGQRVGAPRLGRNEMGRVAEAMAEMRAALDGKSYVADYVQSLTHELKSPTAAISGAAELLQEEMPPAMRRRFLDNIRNESQRLHDIIDRLLELAAIENRSALEEVTQVDLAALVDEAVESLHPLARGRGLHVQTLCEAGLQVQGDRFLLHQALVNLLKNALEFSPDDGEVLLRAEAAKDEVRLVVRDQGPGLPDYAGARVFERFFSLPRPDGRKGSGLGLSFVREIAALHGGRVTLGPAAGGGAEACLVLPAKGE